MRRRPGSGRGSGVELRRILARVRRRWRMRRVAGGAAIVLAVALLTVAATTWGLEATRFSPVAVLGFRVASWSLVALLTAFLVLRPLFRRVSDEQIALYLEEHEPTLEASILGAVEAERAGAAHPEASPLLNQLVARAVRRAARVEGGDRIDRTGLRRAFGSLATVGVAAALLLLLGPADLRRGATALLPTADAATLNPYSIALEPGDLTVARGSDQLVSARLLGFDSDAVTLFTQSADGASARRLSMIPAGEVGAFDLLLLGLDESVEYFVESDGVRSSTYRIEVVDLPYVDRMDHTYRFPAYTGLAPREIEDAGDVAALAGTVVELSILPTIPTPAGRLLRDGEMFADLEVDAEGRLTGELEVRERGYYQIELALGDGRFIAGSPEYRIDLLTDQPPSITITKPGRDAPVSPIEEVFFEVRADDDYGIDEVTLIYSVNGGPEDSVRIFGGGGRSLTDVTADHVLYLEDFEVTPGDLVTYWAETRDGRAGGGQRVVSDIYFLNVQPFSRDFREAEQQGGGGGGGGGAEAGSQLSELQKQVTAATFNLLRDRERWDEDEFRTSTRSVALAQGRVSEQVRTLVQRMGNRGVTGDDQFQEIAEMLPEALAAMDSSRVALERVDPQSALPPQQQALRVLLKAEETYEVYVRQQNEQQMQGGGGGGDRPNAEDLADLFELELDRLQNQYETVERGERQQENEQVDELLERLEELARRQQQEAERQQARARQQGGSSGGGSSAAAQRELADEVEETARELQRLSRESGDPELSETARELQAAADAMRRSAANAGNTGVAEAERALDRLEEASRRLQNDREDRLEEDAQAAVERSRQLREQQSRIREELEELSGDPAGRREQIRELQQEKTDMLAEVLDLERTLDRLAADARQRDPEAARAMTEAAEAIRGPSLPEKIAWSRGVIEERDEAYVRIFESGLETDLQRLEEAVANASREAARVAEEDGLREALEQAEDLVRGTESLDRRLEDRRLGGGPRGSGGERTGEEGSDGDPSQQGSEAEGSGDERSGEEGEGSGERSGDSENEGRAGQQGGRAASDAGLAGGRGGENPIGAPGAQREGPTGGGAVRGDARPFTEDEIRQFRRAFQERLQGAVALRELLEDEGADTGDLDEAIAALRDLQDGRVWSDLPQVEALQETLRQSLGRLEFTLRRIVEGEDSDRAALSGNAAVPEGYRRLVDEYYRALARGGGGGR